MLVSKKITVPTTLATETFPTNVQILLKQILQSDHTHSKRHVSVELIMTTNFELILSGIRRRHIGIYWKSHYFFMGIGHTKRSQIVFRPRKKTVCIFKFQMEEVYSCHSCHANCNKKTNGVTLTGTSKQIFRGGHQCIRNTMLILRNNRLDPHFGYSVVLRKFMHQPHRGSQWQEVDQRRMQSQKKMESEV